MLTRFCTDQNYLSKYHERMALLLFAINTVLFIVRDFSFSDVVWYLPCFFLVLSPQVTFVFAGWIFAAALGLYFDRFEQVHFLGALAGILITFPATALLHGASHGSLRPRRLNRPVGELMGLFQLYGFPDWKVLHVIHHAHSDDPDRDPHPPLAKTYWNFLNGMRDTAAAAFIKYYVKQFGATPDVARSVRRFSRSAKLDTLMKLGFWFLLLGPSYFSAFYLTSIVFKMVHYAWFNFATHRPREGVLNLNHGLYSLVNAVSFGLYYHKNHHRVPTVLDPRRVVNEATAQHVA